MSAQSIVDFVMTERVVTPHEVETKFMFRPERGYGWLQRIAFWFLRKRGCYAIDDRITLRRFTVDTRKFMDNLYRQKSHLIDLYHRSGERLLIGAEDFRDLMAQDGPINQVISFNGSYHYRDEGGIKLMGMEVTIIPWMRGMVVVPKSLS